MTANQFRAALARLDLTQVGAARMFGVNEATARRWARYGVTGAVPVLLRLLISGKITFADIEAAHDR